MVKERRIGLPQLLGLQGQMLCAVDQLLRLGMGVIIPIVYFLLILRKIQIANAVYICIGYRLCTAKLDQLMYVTFTTAKFESTYTKGIMNYILIYPRRSSISKFV